MPFGDTTTISRRRALALAAATATVSACQRPAPGSSRPVAPVPPEPGPPAPAPRADAPAPPAATPIPDPVPLATDAELMIAKLTFGTTPELRARVAGIGVAAWLEEQLEPSALYQATDRLAGLDTLGNSNRMNHQVRQPDGGHDRIIGETDWAAIVRATHSEAQLREVMADFWVNHFTVWRNKDWLDFAHPYHVEQAIRPHALGRFHDMLLASARSLAMLGYLDQFLSNANKPGGVNLNYARELLELHTLGILDGTALHTDADVEAVAKLMAGWGTTWEDGPQKYEFRFEQWFHHRGALSVLGGAWSRPPRGPGAGESDGIDFLGFLAHHPRTARFLATKIARRFVGDDPPPRLVDELAQTYLANDTRIAPVLRVLVASPEFAATRSTKLRRPFEFVVAALRATGASLPRAWSSAGATELRSWIGHLGQPLYEWPTPDGYPDANTHWISSEALLQRWRFAATLARDAIAPKAPPEERVRVDLTGFGGLAAALTVDQLIVQVAADLGMPPLPAPDRVLLAADLGIAPDGPAAPLATDQPALAHLVGILLSHPAAQWR